MDHATSLIFVFNQVSLRAGETLFGNKTVEHFPCNYSITIKHINGYN